jgi:hypothetical protein
MGITAWAGKDFYAVLGVPSEATPADVKQAFHALAKAHHPDVTTLSLDTETRFAEVSEAYEVLSDPRLRERYDESRAAVTTPEVRTSSRGQEVRAPEPGVPVSAGDVEFHAARLNGQGWFALIALGVLVLAVAGFTALSWFWSLDALSANGGPTVSAEARVGQTYYIDSGLGPSPGSTEATVQVESVTASAKLEAAESGTITTVPIRLVACRQEPGVAPVDIVPADQVRSQCTSVRVLTPGDTLEVGEAADHLLYELPLTAAGDYVDLSATLGYSQGRRDAEVTVTSESSTRIHSRR